MKNKELIEMDAEIDCTRKSINFQFWFWICLTAISFVVAILAVFNKKSGICNVSENEKIIMTSIYYICFLAAIPFAFYFFHKKTQEWAKIKNTQVKLRKYKCGANYRTVIIAATGIFGAIISKIFIPENQSFLFCITISLIALLFCRVKKENIINDLNLMIDDEIY